MFDRILRLPEVKTRLGLSRSTLYQRIREKTFPRPISLGARSIGWLEREVSAMLAATVRAEPEVTIRALVVELERDRTQAGV